MNAENKNLIVTVLAVIGGLVVLGWVLRVTFALIGPLLLIAVAFGIYLLFVKKGPGR
jgi:hypothetical protein